MDIVIRASILFLFLFGLIRLMGKRELGQMAPRPSCTRRSRRHLSGITMGSASALDAPVLADIVRRLVAAYQPERIYLFGSMARGDAGPDSDYDVLVVVADDAEPARLASRRGYEALVGTGYAADILVWRQSAFDVRLPLKASLPATVAREGRPLYAA